MEPGTLELQIFVSLIVILGTAFVALICDYLKGNNESLREHNIELRVRKEEQEKHQPMEAVQWLQHLLGATQRNPIRFGSMRPSPRREAQPAATRPAAPAAAPAAQPAAPTRPAAAQVPTVPAVTKPAAATATPHPVEAAAEAKPAALVVSAPATEVAEVGEQRASRLHVGRARRQASGAPNPPSLLDTLPKPAWLQKEQEEKAAVRALREEQQQKAVSVPAPQPEPIEQKVETGKTVAARTEPKRSDPFWTYRGLLDRVVAATSGPEFVDEPVPVTPTTSPVTVEPAVEQATESPKAAEPVIEQVKLVETLTSSPAAPAETITTVTIDVPSQPEPEVTESTEVAPATLFTWNADRPEHTGAEFTIVSDAPVESEPVLEVAEAPHTITIESEPIHAYEGVDFMAAEPKPASPVLVPMPSVPELRLPPGYQDRSVFTKHMHSHDVLTGVVAAIGINDYAHHNDKMGIGPMADLMRSVETMVAGMLRPGIDFGCRSNDDEFILVFPNETGADAQRRLTTISERLWNFQLRSLTSFSVFFSWGAVEVQGETLADAAASASERMYQTKRNRKTLSMDPQRRKLAVNL